MRITRVETDESGETWFQDEDIPLTDAGDIGSLSRVYEVTGMIFRETGPDYDYPWHTAPRKQFVVVLEGEVEVTVTSGEKRHFTAGDIFLLLDTRGKGHYSRALSGKPRKSLFVMVE